MQKVTIKGFLAKLTCCQQVLSPFFKKLLRLSLLQMPFQKKKKRKEEDSHLRSINQNLSSSQPHLIIPKPIQYHICPRLRNLNPNPFSSPYTHLHNTKPIFHPSMYPTPTNHKNSSQTPIPQLSNIYTHTFGFFFPNNYFHSKRG